MMTSKHWYNVLKCASARQDQFGLNVKEVLASSDWRYVDYQRYRREYDTYIMAGAMGARARRLLPELED